MVNLGGDGDMRELKGGGIELNGDGKWSDDLFQLAVEFGKSGLRDGGMRSAFLIDG